MKYFCLKWQFAFSIPSKIGKRIKAVHWQKNRNKQTFRETKEGWKESHFLRGNPLSSIPGFLLKRKEAV